MRPHLHALTSLRFLAAMHVIVVHFGVSTFANGPWWLEELARRGTVGVSVFFTLSGFILAYTYADRRDGALRFWWARFARIYPVYILSLLFAAYAYRGHLSRFAAAGGDTGWLFFKFGTLTQAWTLNKATIGQTTLLNNPTWSLSTEWFFYLVFPLVLLLAMRLPFKALLPSTAAMWVVCMGARWVFAVPELVPGMTIPAWISGELIYKNPLFRLQEFVVGVAFGLWFLREPSWRRNRLLPWVAALLAVILLSTGTRMGIPATILHNGLLAPLIGMLFVGLAAGVGPARLLGGRALMKLGEASYAIYVFHMPVGMYLAELGVVSGSTMHFLATSAFTVGISLLVFRYVERPSRRWLRGLSEVFAKRIKRRAPA